MSRFQTIVIHIDNDVGSGEERENRIKVEKKNREVSFEYETDLNTGHLLAVKIYRDERN